MAEGGFWTLSWVSCWHPQAVLAGATLAAFLCHLDVGFSILGPWDAGAVPLGQGRAAVLPTGLLAAHLPLVAQHAKSSGLDTLLLFLCRAAFVV